MPTLLSEIHFVPGRVPAGYHAVPITAEQWSAPIRVCVLVRGGGDRGTETKSADVGGPGGAGGPLVQVRSHVDARVYLGCVADAGGFVHEWVEVWVQSAEGLVESIPAYRESLSNHALDQRWMAQVRAYERFERPVLVRTGYESVRPPVTLIDLLPEGSRTTRGANEWSAGPAPFHPTDRETGEAWVVCEDDAVLTAAGLPAYSTTLHRYLYLASRGNQGNFVVVTPGSPTNDRTRQVADLSGGREGLVAFNIGAGLLMVRRAGTLSLPAYLDVLSGGTAASSSGGGNATPGVAHGRTTISTGLSTPAPGGSGRGTTGAGSTAADAGVSESGLFLGQQGKWGRLIEVFHLKVRLIADAIASVRAQAESSQRPLLNLSAESFSVYMSEPARGLPHVWSARVSLVDPGDAIALSIKASDAQHYISPGSGSMSIFRPSGAGMPTRGVATLRIRQLVNPQSESLVLEGTLATDQRVEASESDLVWVRVTLGGGSAKGPKGGRIDLYGRLESDAALASGEWRFRTIGQRFSPEDVSLLQSAAGVPLHGSHFEVIPLIATPVDLYSLGVLATKVLLTDSKTSLAVVLDELLSLARQVAKEHDPSVPLPQRVGAIFGQDPRWLEGLGPHRLGAEAVNAKEAFDLVPASLWWETLAAIIRMFPGVGPDSACRGYGDGPFGGMHLVFDSALADFDRVLRQTRSLIVIDWNYNREIHAVVRQYSAGMGGAGSRG
ncbi:MAG: hypothetical protein AB7G11_14705 [Phycisphaerales bacterium]